MRALVLVQPRIVLLCAIFAYLPVWAGVAAEFDDRITVIDPDDYRACSATCAYLVCAMMKIDASFDDITRKIAPDRHGVASMDAICGALKEYGLHPVCLRFGKTDPIYLRALRVPLILSVKEHKDQAAGTHFIVYLGQSPEEEPICIDAPNPPSAMYPRRFQELWTGAVIVPCRSKSEATALVAEYQVGFAGRLVSPAWLAFAIGMVGCVALLMYRKVASRSPKLLALIAIVGSTVWSTGCSEQQVQPAGKLGVEERVILGVIERGGVAAVPVSNSGDEPLAFVQVGTSCTCAVVDAPKTLSPGQSGSITFSVPGGEGPQSTRLLVRSSDPDSPHEVYVSWFCESPPAFVPPRLLIDQIEPGAKIDVPVSLSFATGESEYRASLAECSDSLGLLKLEASSKSPSIQYSDTGASNMRAAVANVEFRVQGTAPMGKDVVRGTLEATIAQAGKEYVLSLPYELRVGTIEQYGALRFRARSFNDLVGHTRVVIVATHSDEAPTIEVCPTYGHCEIAPVAGRAGVYKCEFRINTPPSDMGREREIVLNIPGGARITVPITLAITDA